MLNLDTNEHVLLEVRKHWFVLTPVMTILFVLAFAPLIFSSAFIYFVPVSISKISGVSAGTFFYALWLLCLWIYFFINWTNYYLDVWFITEKRIISIDQVSIFHRKISNLGLDKIQDVSIEQKGIMQSTMKFGDILVKTAAEGDTGFYLKDADNPDRVREIIFSHHVYEHEKAKPVVVVDKPSEYPKNVGSDFDSGIL
ncbi:MAG: PH domain-containing protein [Minisyncoccia bacterium]